MVSQEIHRYFKTKLKTKNLWNCHNKVIYYKFWSLYHYVHASSSTPFTVICLKSRSKLASPFLAKRCSFLTSNFFRSAPTKTSAQQQWCEFTCVKKAESWWTTRLFHFLKKVTSQIDWFDHYSVKPSSPASPGFLVTNDERETMMRWRDEYTQWVRSRSYFCCLCQ